MQKPHKKYTTLDEYVSSFPPLIKSILEEIRKLIQKLAPEAEEALVYQIPTFKLNGNLVHFAAFQNHIGFYPTPSGIKAFAGELAPYKTSQGTVQFSDFFFSSRLRHNVSG